MPVADRHRAPVLDHEPCGGHRRAAALERRRVRRPALRRQARQGPPGPAPAARGAVARDDRRARRARRCRCSATRFLSPSLADISIPFVSGYSAAGRRSASSPAGRRSRSASPTTCATASACSAGRSCTASRRWPGSPAIVHSIGEGTDAGATWFLVATAIVVLPALALLAVRHLGAPAADAARRAARGPQGDGGR